MEYRVSWLTVISRKDFEQFKTAEDLQNFANDKPLGSGPFKLTTFDKGQGVIILDANPDYFLGRPKIDQVIFQTFDNENALVQALKVGDVDALTEVPSTGCRSVEEVRRGACCAADGARSLATDHQLGPRRSRSGPHAQSGAG